MRPSPTHLVAGLVALLGIAIVALRTLGSGGRAPLRVSAEGSARVEGHQGLVAPDSERSGTRDRSAPGRSRGPWSAPIGSELVFELSGRSSAKVALTQDGQVMDQTLEHRLAGRMRVLVADRREDELVTQVDFPGMRIEASAEGRSGRDTPTEEAVAQPTLVHMRDDGRVLGFRFVPGVSPEARNWIRSQVTAFRFEVDGSGAEEWEREETDPTGTARVRYEREPRGGNDETGEIELRRRKISYAPVRAGGDGVSVEVVPEVRSEGSAIMSASLGWLREARVEERLVLPVARLGLETTVVLEESLRLVEQRGGVLAALPEVDWDGEWATVAGADDLLAMEGEKMLRGLLIDGLSLDELVTRIDLLATTQPRDDAALMDARHELAEYLSEHPEAFDALAELVVSMHPATADIVLGAAGSAGTEPAQRLLAGVLGDQNLSVALRQSSLDAMFQLTRPIAEAYGAVGGLLGDRSQDGSLRANGMLLLGALTSMHPADGVEGPGQIESLLALEEAAREEGRIEHWLHALGNSGDARAVEAASPYLSHADARVRIAAAEAMRNVDTSAATEALSRLARKDLDATVRRATASILAARADTESLQTVRGLLVSEPEVAVRRAAVDALARRAGEPDVRTILGYVADNDASPDLRQRARECL